MQSVLEIEKEGIFVSSKAYNSLYKKAKEEYIKKINEDIVPQAVKGPFVVQANYTGSIQGDVLKLSIAYKIVSNTDKAVTFPFS